MWVNGDYRKGVSVMDRHLARAYEALKIAEAMDGWLNQLTAGAKVYNTYTNPTTGSGIGLTEAARGALGHWVKISAGKISSYQVVTPTCWNASPMDTKGVKGPMEQALIGTPIAKPANPIEALRVIHSFDPCLSCAVHVMRPDGKPVVIHAESR
jgi:hydrogenase large subunit